MSCYKNCRQGRDCDCFRGGDKQVVVAVLFIVLMVSIGCLVFKILTGNTGQDCAVEVQFKDSKATYIGQSI
jgi:hypothetical protein